MKLFENFNLIVKKRFLLFEAALAWAFAGVMLLYRGVAMLNFTGGFMLLRIITCLGFGGLFYRLIFARISLKHIDRIKTLTGDYHFFYQFFSARSYLMMVGMISLGVFVRTTSLVPVSSLSFAYMMMGFPLLISSFRFYHYWYNYVPAIGEPNN